MSSSPTVADITALPEALVAAVSSEFVDFNGHMNVLHYLEFTSLGADALVRGIGIDDAYHAKRRLGVFTAEHHLRYYGELLEGDSFAVYGRFLNRSTKVVHLMTFLVDQRRDRLACTLEIVLVHVDLASRRPTPIPEDVGGALDQRLIEGDAMNWAAPTCGAMGVRG